MTGIALAPDSRPVLGQDVAVASCRSRCHLSLNRPLRIRRSLSCPSYRRNPGLETDEEGVVARSTRRVARSFESPLREHRSAFVMLSQPTICRSLVPFATSRQFLAMTGRLCVQPATRATFATDSPPPRPVTCGFRGAWPLGAIRCRCRLLRGFSGLPIVPPDWGRRTRT